MNTDDFIPITCAVCFDANDNLILTSVEVSGNLMARKENSTAASRLFSRRKGSTTIDS